jgi:hypothetical protein
MPARSGKETLPACRRSDLDHVQVKATDGQLVAVQEPAPVDALTVHEEAIETPVVEHPQWLLAFPDDQCVATRDGRVVEPDVRSDAAADSGPAALVGKDLKLVVFEGEIAAGGVERVSRGLEPSRRRRLRGNRKLGRCRLIAGAFEDRRAPETLASAAGAFGNLVLSFERNL